MKTKQQLQRIVRDRECRLALIATATLTAMAWLISQVTTNPSPAMAVTLSFALFHAIKLLVAVSHLQ